MRFNSAPVNTMFATLRIKRSPYGNKRVAFVLRVAHAQPVHTHALDEQQVSLYVTTRDVQAALEAMRVQHNCKRAELDIANDVAKLLAKNDGERAAA